MRPSRVKQKLKNNELVLITCLHLTDPSTYELTSLMGFDGIWMDMEHHGYSLETAAHLMRAARVGSADIVVRPAKGEYMRIGRILEAGANGVMYPRCGSAREAAEVVRWTKFAPLGTRGFDGAGADMPYCTMAVDDYVAQANTETFIIVQLEDQASVDAADEIAAVEGVDALMFGPADYTILSGIPGQFNHPRIQESLRKIADAAKRHGKHWGTPSGTLEHCQRLLDLGARIHFHGADILMVKNGLEQIQRQFEPIGFTFANSLQKSGRSYMEQVRAAAPSK